MSKEIEQWQQQRANQRSAENPFAEVIPLAKAMDAWRVFNEGFPKTSVIHPHGSIRQAA